MREYGIDMSRRRSKHLDEFTGRHFDYVITLCDKVREICPEFSGAEAIHWSIPDPAAEDSRRSSYPAFRAVATDLQTRIHFLVRQLFTAGAAG